MLTSMLLACLQLKICLKHVDLQGISMAADEVQVDLEASSMALQRERERERAYDSTIKL